MILSASRRTDIPCCYADWFMNRIRAGSALVRNPMNPAQLSKITLSADVVDCIVFWTKDAAPLLPFLSELDALGYAYYFQFTLTPYDRNVERNLRPKVEIEETFLALSRLLGRERVVWRYDPIILNETLTVDYHKTEFLRLCQKLAPYTDTVVFSFVDLYAKLNQAMNGLCRLRPAQAQEIAQLVPYLAQTAKAYGLRAAACCEKLNFAPYGVEPSSCIDRERIEKIIGVPLKLKADKNQRPGCGCCESVDLGAYNSCANGCVYCYATAGAAAAAQRCAQQNPFAPLLGSEVKNSERIVERKTESAKVRQLSFLDENLF